jgi:hypothetical protein
LKDDLCSAWPATTWIGECETGSGDVHSDCFQMVDNCRKSRNNGTLSKDLNVHHICQHFASRMLMQDHCDDLMMINVQLINAADKEGYERPSQVLKLDISCMISKINKSPY